MSNGGVTLPGSGTLRFAGRTLGGTTISNNATIAGFGMVGGCTMLLPELTWPPNTRPPEEAFHACAAPVTTLAGVQEDHMRVGPAA